MPFDLTERHSFRLHSCAKEQLQISSEKDLHRLDQLDEYLILAGGTNTLFVEYYPGTIVSPRFTGIEISELEDGYQIRVGASENWHDLVTYCCKKNINGLENLALIPGTVGAAPVQNIGAYGREVSDFIVSVECYSLASHATEILLNHECGFDYRDSLFKRHPNRYLITHVTFFLPKQWSPVLEYGPLQSLNASTVDAQTIYQKVIDIRNQKLPNPAITPNAGSFFKNPVVSSSLLDEIKQIAPDIPTFPAAGGSKIAAGWMIDQLGFKGRRCGDIAVHDKQALVLVNLGNGTGSQLVELCQQIRAAVLHRYKVLLEPEVRLIGKQGLMRLPDVGANSSE